MAKDVRLTFTWRAVRAVAALTLTLTFVAGAGFAVLVASETLATRAEANAPDRVAEKMPVQVTELSPSRGYTVPRQFVGQVEATANVSLSFELAGQLTEVLVDEGEPVVKGQTLARLDTSLLEAEEQRLIAARQATAAQLVLAESRLVRASALRQDGFASEEALDQTRAARDELISRIEETDAAIRSVAINIEKSEIRAPFNGRVGVRNVDGGETLGAGTPVMTLIETALPHVRVGLPLALDIREFERAQMRIGGRIYGAALSHVRPDIDPVTRTRTAVFSLDAQIDAAFGQTATLLVDTTVTADGTWVPLDALQEGVGGVWTILVVDGEVVRPASVEILYAEATRAYVRGTFEPGAYVIDRGAHRVVPGQLVRAITGEG